MLRKFFLIDRIYFRQTPIEIIYSIIWVFLLCFLVAVPANQASVVPVTVTALLVGVYALLRMIVRSYIIYRRTKNLPNLLPLGTMQSKFFRSATNDELNDVDYTQLLAEGDSWKLFDARFDFYRKTKHGEYLAKQVYYTVFESQLHRPVPNIIFDSKRAKGQQFRYRYLASQKLSLEGDFDHYFSTYAPDYYKIDSLSFITPEVMHELIAGSEYDIELVDDRLFLYGPLLEGETLDALRATGQRIGAALNDNLDTYRDSYLVGSERTTNTTAFARKLLRSPLKPLLATMGLTIVLLPMFFLVATADQAALTPILQFGFVFVLVWAQSAYQVIKIVRENHKAQQTFQRTAQYAQQARKT